MQVIGHILNLYVLVLDELVCFVELRLQERNLVVDLTFWT